jgi:hypothetical protein
MVLHGGGVHREPHQRGGAAMAGQQREHDGGLPVRVELGPVHRHVDAAARSHHVRHPVTQCDVDIDPLVGQQPIHLLDRMLGHQAACQGKPLTDGIDRQGRGLDYAQGGVGQRQHALGVQVAIEQAVQEAAHLIEAKGPARCHRLPRESCCMRGDSPVVDFRQPIREVRCNANPDRLARSLFRKPGSVDRFFCYPPRSTWK